MMDFIDKFKLASIKALAKVVGVEGYAAGKGRFNRIEANRETIFKVSDSIGTIMQEQGNDYLAYSGVTLGLNDGLKDNQVIFEVEEVKCSQ